MNIQLAEKIRSLNLNDIDKFQDLSVRLEQYTQQLIKLDRRRRLAKNLTIFTITAVVTYYLLCKFIKH